MKKRLFAFILAALFIVSTVPAVSAANGAGFPDMPDETYWSYDALVSAVENGLLRGSNGNLNPKSNLTRAQMAAIVNRAFGAEAKSDISGFSDVAKSDWFFEDVAKAVRMGTFTGTGGGKMSPNNPISREQAFTVVARALKLEGGDESVLSRFSDAGDISLYARGPIAAMTAAGYVNGSGGKVNPRSTITREEFAQVFHNVIKKYVRTAGTATGGVDGNVIVNVPGVTLKGMKIDGDLIVGEGVGNGEIVLDSVTVTGRVVVRGGGVNSVIIKNGTDVGSIVIGKTGDGGVRVRTEEGCHVEIVVIDDGLDTVILEGEYNQVRIDSDVEVVLRDADIVGLTVTAEGANVSLEGDTSVVSAMITDDAKNSVLSVGGDSSVRTLSSYGDGATVSGDGAITSADVSGDGTAFNVSGTQLYVEKGTKGVTENGNAVAGGASVYTGGEQPHVHSWIGGTETPATCTEPGKKVYTCSCGETMEKEIPALGHEWGEGVITKEPTEQEDGVETFTCLRCGTSRTESVSFLAFAVELPEGGFALFRTLGEAIEEASKYEHHNSPDEPEWTEYAVIHQFNPVTINDITIPAGHTLMVGSDLRLTGDLNLGTSDYSYCPGMGTCSIMVELS